MKLEKIDEGIVYENKLPQLRSRHSYFPAACERDDGVILVSHVIGEAFESVDLTTYVSISSDLGRHFTLIEQPLADLSDVPVPVSDSFKLTNAGGQHLLAFGYGLIRSNPELPIGNSETGGLLDSQVLFMESFDGGLTFSKPLHINTTWGDHAEASAPLTILPNGDYVAPIAPFPKWDGTMTGKNCGRLIRSSDKGKNWHDQSVTMDLGDDISVWEQRLCRLDQDTLVVIAWNENLANGGRLNNHYAISHDRGLTFAGPFDTGVGGQAASVCSIGGNRLVAFHSMRREGDKQGVLACIVNLKHDRWEVEETAMIWMPSSRIVKDTGMADVFSMLKFGQPSAILLSDGTLFYTQWVIENNQGRTIWMRLAVH